MVVMPIAVIVSLRMFMSAVAMRVAMLVVVAMDMRMRVRFAEGPMAMLMFLSTVS